MFKAKKSSNLIISFIFIISVLILSFCFSYNFSGKVGESGSVKALAPTNDGEWWSHQSSSLDVVDGIYQIKSAEDLAYLASTVNTGGALNGETFMLVNEIDLSAYWWVPIGAFGGSGFYGTFIGGGEATKIKGLFAQSGYDYAGLFGEINGNTVIKNVVIEGANINTNQDSVLGTAAALVAGANSGSLTIENCECRNIDVFGNTYASGIVGDTSGASLKVESCKVSGSIKSASTAAGIVGRASSGTKVEINDCYNSAVISATTGAGIISASSNYTITNCTNNAGAPAGITFTMTGGTIENCKNYGLISSTNHTGGIVGTLKNGKITGCFNFGKVAGSIEGGVSIGGMVGLMQGGSITSCVNMGEVSSSMNVGGLVGNMQGGEIFASHNCGRVYAPNNTYSSGGIVGIVCVSGISAISNCSNTGDVTGVAAGGLVGRCMNERANLNLVSCYNLGTVDSIINDWCFVGSFVGILKACQNVNITGCLSIGSVSHSGTGNNQYEAAMIGCTNTTGNQVVIKGSAVVMDNTILADRNRFYGNSINNNTSKPIVVDSSYIAFLTPEQVDSIHKASASYSTYQTSAYEELFVQNPNFMDGLPIPKGIFWIAEHFEGVTVEKLISTIKEYMNITGDFEQYNGQVA